jgi:signal transduction histidine kinase
LFVFASAGEATGGLADGSHGQRGGQPLDGGLAIRAGELRTSLTRTAPAPTDVRGEVESVAIPSEVDADLLATYRVARVYLDRGDVDAARAELEIVLEQAAGWPDALNLDAALHLRQGDEGAARQSWRRSLEIEPAQPRVRLVLGELARKLGAAAEAEGWFREAAEGGIADAHYYLAVMSVERHQLLDAAAELDAYFEGTTGGLAFEPAQQLQAEVVRRIRLYKAAVGGGGAFLLGGLVLLIWRRRGRKPLGALLELVPSTAHEVARRLSAIRHEVLKHNTSLLEDVAHALEHGDHHAVAFAAVRLFGDQQADRGVIHRFHKDLAGLQQLGRQHGVRLDLRRKDPVLGPMWRAMGRLAALEGALRRPWRAGRHVPGELRDISKVLNQEGYRALGRWIRSMGTVGLDPATLHRVAARVRAEAGLEGAPRPELEVEMVASSVPVHIFAGDLEDVLANLFRNAHRALADGCEGTARLGILVVEDDDPVTGHEHVLLRVRDTAAGTLTDAQILGRDIGHGLGLVVDLITRHGGSIHVEAEPGWAKAVVVTLNRAEGEA